MSMQFEILGPMRSQVGSVDLNLARRREGRILAVLLLSSRQVVSLDRLIDLLWGENPPATARQQVQNCVTNLVRLFRDVHADLPLRRAHSGYALDVRREDLDATVFEDEVERARRLAESGCHPAAIAQLRSATGRWRGQVLLGTDLGLFHPRAARLEELRLEAVEQLFHLELGLGRHNEVVADLALAVAANPERERLVGHHMIALARTGRAAEALAVFQRTRRLLHQEYAIEPGQDLRAIQLSILRDTAVPPPAGESSDEQHHRLLTAMALAETARQQLDLALRGARDFARGAQPLARPS